MFRNKVKKNLDIELGELHENSGLRAIAKMCLNSLWGKFGQRNNMNQCKYVTDINEFYQVVLDDTIGNLNMNFINDEMVQMSYTYKDQFVDNSYNTNIYIASYTTSSARLMLYDKLDYLNEQVLYFDTDSIIYIESTRVMRADHDARRPRLAETAVRTDRDARRPRFALTAMRGDRDSH